MLGRNSSVQGQPVGAISRACGARRIGIAALMLAGTALAPAQAQVADLGGTTVSRNDFVSLPGLLGIEPTEITNGTLRINPLQNGLNYGGNLTNSGGTLTFVKFGVKDLTLSGVNTHSGITAVQGGRLILGSATALSPNSQLTVSGSAGGPSYLDMNGFNGTVRSLSGNATGIVTAGSGPAILTIDGPSNQVFSGALQGNLGIVKRGTGVQTFTNTDPVNAPTTATGPITLEAGGLRIGSSNALGSGVMTVTGPAALSMTGSVFLNFDNNVVLNNTLTVAVAGNQNLTMNGVISGSGALNKIGVGLGLVLNGANTYTGGTTLAGGFVFVGNPTAFGTGLVTQTDTSIIGLANSAQNLTLANNFSLQGSSLQLIAPDAGVKFTLTGNITGGPDINIQTGPGTVELAGTNSIAGFIRLQSGTLGVANAAAVNGSQAMRVEANGTSVVFSGPGQTITTRLMSRPGSGALTVRLDHGAENLMFAGALRDGDTAGGHVLRINKFGTGIFTASNGDTNLFNNNIVSGGFVVEEGTLNLTGRMTNTIEVRSGARLTGTGVQDAGIAVIDDSATLSPGDALAAGPAIGKLTLQNLILSPTSVTLFDLGAPSIDTINPANDLVVVTSNIALDGEFRFNILPGFGDGTYRLMTYGVALTGNVTLGVLPAGFDYTLNTSGGFVDLVVALQDRYWDGSGPFGNNAVNGGDGTWNAGNSNWTNDAGAVTAGWVNDGRGYFTATGGTVTVDGNFTYQRLIFTADGYVLNPAAGATLAAIAGGTLEVTAGNSTTITVDLVGSNGLAKAGDGTLVLGGNNSFTGDLRVNGGTLAVTQAAALGGGAVTLGFDTTLRFDSLIAAANDIRGPFLGTAALDTGVNLVALNGRLLGDSIQKLGAGTLELLNSGNALSNGLSVDAGSVIVRGAMQGSVTVASTALIGGTGTIDGPVTVDGFLSAGRANNLPGTLTTGAVSLGAAATSLFDLGEVGVVGVTNDLVIVNGDLALGGFLTIRALAGWNIGTGQYRLFNYTGALSGSLTLDGLPTLPPNGVVYSIDTATAGEVNLVVGYGGAFNWDGNGAVIDGVVQGGAGTWNAAATNWTSSDGLFNLAWVDSATTVGNFGGVSGGGTVTVDGTRSFGRLNFTTGGYTLTGGTLAVDASTIDTATGITTIASSITGTAFTKVGTGELVLSGSSDVGFGDSRVAAGMLTVTGSLTNSGFAVDVDSGATLNGTGTIAGTARLADGATLAIGGSGTGLFTLGNLTLSSGSLLNFQLGAANTLGGPLNDRVVVTGDLTLDGQLTVTESVGGAFTIGFYNLFSYGGTLTDNGLTIGGALPNALSGTVQINSSAQQVNLIVAGADSLVLNWDGTDFTGAGAGPQGGNGGWDADNTNWTGSAPGEVNVAWQNNAIGIFGVTGGTVDVNAALNFGGLVFQAGGYVLANDGGSLVTNAALGSFISVDAGLTAIIDATIAGTGTLFKQGAGTLLLGGTNSLTGNISLANGTIGVTSDGALGTGSLIFTGGTTLRTDAVPVTLANAMTLNGQSNIVTDGPGFTLNGVLSGTGALVKGGAGTLVLNGANSYTGGTALNAGTITVGNNAALGTGALVAAGGTTLAAGPATAQGPITLANSIVTNGVLTIDLQGTTGDVSSAGILTVDGNDLVLAGPVSGAGSLAVTNFGRLSLNGSNSHSGGTSLSNAAIYVGSDTALGTGALTVDVGVLGNSSGATRTLANAIQLVDEMIVLGPNDLVLGGVISGAGQIGKHTTSTLVLNGANSFAGGIDLSGGTIVAGTSSALGTGSLSVENIGQATTLRAGANGLVIGNAISLDTAANLIVDSQAFGLTLSGAISGPGGLSKVGSGTLNLSRANSYSGGTALNAGTITVGNNAALGTGALTMADGTTLAAGANGLSLANAVATAGVGTIDTGANTLTLSGVVSGAGSIAKVGSGTLVLNGANTYAGGTSLTAGTLRAGNNAALGTGALAMANGTTLQAGAANLAIANAVTLAGSNVVDVNGQVLTLGGVISGTGPLSVIDSQSLAGDALILTGVNSYTGGTVVTGTTVQVSQDANLGNAAGGLTLVGGTLRTTASFTTARGVTLGTGSGAIDVATGTTLTSSGVISGTALTKLGGGTLALNGANTHSGGTALNAGTIAVGNAGALGTGALAMAGGTTLQAAAANLALANAISTAGVGTIDTGANTLTLNGVISGAGSIAKAGTGTLVLNGSNSHAGGTTLGAGTIQVGSSTALGTGTLTMAGGTTLVAGAAGLTTANAIVTQGAATIITGASPAAYTLSGVISGAGSLTKQGTGTLTVSGVSTYTGPTTVAAGTLNVTGRLASPVTVNAGAALTGNGTVGALTVLSGGSINPGAPGSIDVATLNVAGAVTLAGTYSVNIAGAASDLIAATGAITLGGTLTVASVTPPLFGQEFVVASGASVTGTFANTTGLELFGPAFRPVVAYTPTTAVIRINPNNLVNLGNSFGGLTGNPLEAAQAFDRAVSSGFNPQAFFPLYSNAGSSLSRVMREVSGEQRATERRVVLDSNRVFRETALDRLNLGLAAMAGQQVSSSDGDRSITFWLRGAGSWGKAQTSGAATSFQTEQVGLLTGIDWSRDALTVGGMFHYTTTNVEFGVIGGSSRVETVGGTVYAGYRNHGGLVANIGASASGARTNGSRTIALTGFNQTLSGRTTGTTYQGFGELGWDLAASADTRIEPFARLSYVKADMNGLAETGGIAALVAAKQSYDLTIINLGMRFGANVGKVALNGSASMQGTTGDRDAMTVIGIPAVGQNGNIRSVLIDRTALLLQGGVGVNLSDKIRFNVDYNGLIGKRNDDHGARATLNFAF